MKTLTLHLVLVVAGIYCSAQSNAAAGQMDELTAKYKHASSEKERMAVCIEAIDSGLVHRGCTTKAFDMLFGTTLSKSIPAAGQPMERAALNFADQLSSESDDEATPFVGWYLSVEFDSRGLIQNYYLSNLHK